jgi:hypothetical protein
VRVGDVTLRLHSRDDSPLRLPAELRAFSATRGADIDVEVRTAALPVPSAEPLFVSGGLWTAYRQGRRLLYVIREPVRGRAPLSALLIDEPRRKGRLFLAPGAPFALHYPLEDGPSKVTAPRRHGGARLRRGRERTGAPLLRRLRRRQDHDRAPLAPPPAGGGDPQRRPHDRARASRPAVGVRHPLARLGALRLSRLPAAATQLADAGKPSVTRIAAHKREATELFARAFPPPWEAAGSARVLDLCARAAEEVPCARLRFRPDASAVRAVRAALRPPPAE